MVLRTIKEIENSKEEQRAKGKIIPEKKREYIELKSVEPIEIKFHERLLYHNSVTLAKHENIIYVNLNKRIKHRVRPSKNFVPTSSSLLIPIEHYDDFVDTLIDLRDRIHESGIKQIKTNHIAEAITRRQNIEQRKMSRSSFSFLD